MLLVICSLITITVKRICEQKLTFWIQCVNIERRDFDDFLRHASGEPNLNTLQLSIVHRLPQSYRWLAGFTGSKVEPIPQPTPDSEGSLVALKLLSPNGEKAWPVMHSLSQALTDISVDSSVVECEGEPCLFVNSQDEFTATCRLKNFGVAIAEPFTSTNPF